MERQDRQGARTVSDLERKYNLRNFGKQFAEVMGIATDARNTAEAVDDKLDKEIGRIETKIEATNEGIFLRLEELENGVTADLSLVVFKDDYDQVVSMINASADVIRLTSGRLVVESDNFALDENGLVSIGFGDGKGFINTDTHYLQFPDFEVRKTPYAAHNNSYISMRHAKVGCTEFYSSGNDEIDGRGVYFGYNGVRMRSGASSSVITWNEYDSDVQIFRVRGGVDGLHIEGRDYADGELDLHVFGYSFKSLIARIEALENGGGYVPPEEPEDVLLCSECGEVLVEEVLWHDEPTCTTEGWDCYGCANCGYGTRDVSLGFDPDNHTYEHVATEPKDDGTYVDIYECSGCGAIEERPH